MAISLAARALRTTRSARPRRAYHQQSTLPPAWHVLLTPAFEDNYQYALLDVANRVAALVDPACPSAAARLRTEAADSHGCEVTCLLVTHWHWDHAPAEEVLAWQVPTVYGPTLPGNPDAHPVSIGVCEDTHCSLPGSHSVQAWSTPGHTDQHCVYVVPPAQDSAQQPSAQAASSDADTAVRPALCSPEGSKLPVWDARIPDGVTTLFSGDTLFLGGCGRVFSGTLAQLEASVLALATRLPPATAIFCGHEYTRANLAFGAATSPSPQAVQAALARADAQLLAGTPTVPGMLRDELAHNVFVQAAMAGQASAPGQSFAELRQRKDSAHTWLSVQAEVQRAKSAGQPAQS